MLKPICIRCGDRTVEFAMNLDPNFVQDGNISYYLQNAVPPEPELVHFMLRALREGDLAIDAGANVGFFTLLLSRCVGPTGQVMSIEPGANNLRKLQENIELNKISNIALRTDVIGQMTGDIDFYLSRDSGINSVWKNEAASLQTCRVNSVRLDDLWKHDKPPRLIKMDIEGSELEALRGATNLLAKHPDFIIMEFNEQALTAMGASVKEIRYLLADFGYELFMLSELGFFPALVPVDFSAKVDRNNTNVLFTTFKDLHSAFSEVVV